MAQLLRWIYRFVTPSSQGSLPMAPSAASLASILGRLRRKVAGIRHNTFRGPKLLGIGVDSAAVNGPAASMI